MNGITQGSDGNCKRNQEAGTMEQQVLGFLQTGTKTSLEICSQFNLTVVDVVNIMKDLKRKGHIWQRKQRTMGNRSVSRWGIKELE